MKGVLFDATGNPREGELRSRHLRSSPCTDAGGNLPLRLLLETPELRAAKVIFYIGGSGDWGAT